MEEKKTGRVCPRVTPTFKARFEEAARRYGPNASAVMENLMQALITADEQHPGRLVWPLEINYFPPSEKTAQQLRSEQPKEKG